MTDRPVDRRDRIDKSAAGKRCTGISMRAPHCSAAAGLNAAGHDAPRFLGVIGRNFRGALVDEVGRYSPKGPRYVVPPSNSYSRLMEALSKAPLDLPTWESCFPEFAQLMAEVRQQKIDAARAKEDAAADALKPANRLRQASGSYRYVQWCNEVRQGYAFAYVNGRRLSGLAPGLRSRGSSGKCCSKTTPGHGRDMG